MARFFWTTVYYAWIKPCCSNWTETETRTIACVTMAEKPRDAQYYWEMSLRVKKPQKVVKWSIFKCLLCRLIQFLLKFLLISMTLNRYPVPRSQKDWFSAFYVCLMAWDVRLSSVCDTVSPDLRRDLNFSAIFLHRLIAQGLGQFVLHFWGKSKEF